ncbi:helix-turn-helix domain-containing protein [Vibrio sp. PNB22_4_1]
MDKKKMTSRDWIRAEAMFESGDYTLQQIADEFGIHKMTVQRHMKKRDIEKGAAAKKIA